MNNKIFIRDINILWNLVWNNIYIKTNIYKHLKLYSLNYSIRKFNSFNDLVNFKYYQYLNEIEIGSLIDEEIDLSILYNIKSIQIDYQLIRNKSLINNLIIPSNIQELKLINWVDDKLPSEITNGSTRLNIKRLVIKYQKNKIFSDGLYKNTLAPIKIPSSVTELSLYENIHLIDQDTLSKNLKKLKIINHINNHSLIEKGSFPNSLLRLSIVGIDLINFEPGYLPNDLEKLKLKVSSGWFTVSNGFQFPQKLKHLTIDCQTLNFKLPPNLESCSIRIAFYNGLTFENFPNKSNKLNSLSINLNSFEDEGKSILFDYSSIKSLIISSDLNERLKPNSLPSKLEYLEFKSNGSCVEILFPTTTGFNNHGYLLDCNVLPNSLTFLNFGNYFNQSIQVDVIPQSLKTLILGSNFNSPIIDKSIPFGLELMVIENSNFNKTFNKLSNPMTIVDCEHYYKQFIESRQDELITFKISSNHSNPQFSLLYAVNLKYLDLSSYSLNRSIVHSLPMNNQIKTLILSDLYFNTINLEDFKYLEQIIIKGINNGPTILTTTTTTNQSLFLNDTNKQQITYNFYSLKTIQVNYKNTIFIDKLNTIFQQFIHLQG